MSHDHKFIRCRQMGKYDTFFLARIKANSKVFTETIFLNGVEAKNKWRQKNTNVKDANASIF